MADETMQTPETTTPTPTPVMAEESVLTSPVPEAPAAETPAPEPLTYGEFKLPDGTTVDGEQMERAT